MPLTTVRHDSEDVDVVVSALGQMYPKVQLDAPRGGVRFRADIRGDDRLSIARLSMGFHAEVVVEPAGMFTAAMLLGGELHTEHGDGRDVGGIVFGQEETTAEYRSSELLVVNVPEATLLDHWVRTNGADTAVVRLRDHRPVPEHAEAWSHAMSHVYRNVVRVESAFENDLVRTAAFDHLLSLATQALPFEFTARALAGPGAGAATVRRAIAFMESHLGEAITVDDVAAAARVSARGLQSTFRRHRDMTPMAYLRRARLAAAHEELVADEARSVRDVALRWGFSNTGRFNRLRRDAYGTPGGPGAPADPGNGSTAD